MSLPHSAHSCYLGFPFRRIALLWDLVLCPDLREGRTPTAQPSLAATRLRPQPSVIEARASLRLQLPSPLSPRRSTCARGGSRAGSARSGASRAMGRCAPGELSDSASGGVVARAPHLGQALGGWGKSAGRSDQSIWRAGARRSSALSLGKGMCVQCQGNSARRGPRLRYTSLAWMAHV